MINTINPVLLLCTLIALVRGCTELYYVQRDNCPHWSYEEGEGNGPTDWGNLCSDYAICSSGLHQSPINVVVNRTIQVTERPTDLIPHYEEEHSVTFINNGHTVVCGGCEMTKEIENETRFLTWNTQMVANTDAQNSLTLPDGSVYTLQQFHFHDTSEHSLNGKTYPLEMHLVHADAHGNTAVLAFFYDAGAGSELIQELSDTFSAIEEENETTTVPLLELQRLITKPFDFYFYNGSLTTPPCTENVKWFISDTILTASTEQLKEISTLMGINHRPPQPINDRNLTRYQLNSTSSNSDSSHNEYSESPGLSLQFTLPILFLSLAALAL